MKVSGEISTTQVANLFQWIDHQYKTGSLSLTGDVVSHTIYFSQGIIAGVETTATIIPDGNSQEKLILKDALKLNSGRYEFIEGSLSATITANNLQMPVGQLLHEMREPLNSNTVGSKPSPSTRTEESPFRVRSIIIDRVLRGKFTSPLLPTVATKVLQITRRENYSLNDLSNIILTDQVIAANILKQANSPLFSGGREVDTLPMAIQRIGSDTVTKLVFALSLQSVRSDKDIFLKKKKKLWEHSSACALFARFIALPVRLDHNLAFLCGLMQDFGKIVLLSIIQEVMTQEANTRRLSEEEIEEILETYHPRVGSIVGEEWKLPTQVLAAMLLHHSLSEEGEVGQYAAIANLSDLIATYVSRLSEDEIASLLDENMDAQLIAAELADSLANRILDLSIEQISNILARAPECLKSAHELTKI